MDENNDIGNEIVRMAVEDAVPLGDVVRILNTEFPTLGLTYQQAYHQLRKDPKGHLQVRPITQDRVFLPDGRVRRKVCWSMRNEQGMSIRAIMAALNEIGYPVEYQVVARDCTYERNKAREAEWNTAEKRQLEDA